MTVELGVLRKGTWWKYWPCFLGGFVAPLLGNLLTRWLPFHFAIGIAFFVTWFFIGLILTKYFPPKRIFPKWLAALTAAAATGLCGGALAYLIPWK